MRSLILLLALPVSGSVVLAQTAPQFAVAVSEAPSRLHLYRPDTNTLSSVNDVRSALALPFLPFPDLPAGATIAAQQTIELRDGAQ